ncbi:MAG: hypothetical protein WEC14_08440 [Chloroflexota bacterium]
MLTQALRFFLLRFLPRRLVPILTVIEVVRMIRRLRRQPPAAVTPRRLRISGETPPDPRSTTPRRP